MLYIKSLGKSDSKLGLLHIYSCKSSMYICSPVKSEFSYIAKDPAKVQFLRKYPTSYLRLYTIHGSKWVLY